MGFNPYSMIRSKKILENCIDIVPPKIMFDNLVDNAMENDMIQKIA